MFFFQRPVFYRLSNFFFVLSKPRPGQKAKTHDTCSTWVNESSQFFIFDRKIFHCFVKFREIIAAEKTIRANSADIHQLLKTTIIEQLQFSVSKRNVEPSPVFLANDLQQINLNFPFCHPILNKSELRRNPLENKETIKRFPCLTAVCLQVSGNF